MELTRIRRYPVKSMRGEDLAHSPVEPWGLAGDRRWMVVDDDGRFVSAREAPRLLLVTPEVTDAGLCLRGPDLPDLDVATPGPTRRTTVRVWSSSLDAADTGEAAADWVSAVAGRPARLVHMDDPTARPTDPTYSRDGDRVSLADGYPLLLTTEASLAALDDALLEDSEGFEEPLAMTRFRPNVVLAGAPAWAEDDWRRLRIGDAVFRAVKGCARCAITTKDPETAEGGREPLRTLARIRRYDGQTWFGVNLVPDLDAEDAGGQGTGGPVLRTGDQVEVLDEVSSGAGPLR